MLHSLGDSHDEAEGSRFIAPSVEMGEKEGMWEINRVQCETFDEGDLVMSDHIKKKGWKRFTKKSEKEVKNGNALVGSRRKKGREGMNKRRM